ncbi:MAG: preprotein translocase subunit SecE [Prevotella sp.]|nr:preprotein translocase subunit SecE [Alistipes senegalensis]MCM1357386.1 preprotein translocase subunit SecE [Prevotella sp.]MCM1473121.1 preprotein translocase subunit SecE [Muribaculaceae bacterium]
MAKEKENTTPETKKKTEKPVKEEKVSKADKKSDKKNSEKKEQGKVGKWFHDLKVEFKKVVWPTKKTVVTNTSVVVAVIAASAVLVGLLDEGFLALLRLIYQ